VSKNGAENELAKAGDATALLCRSAIHGFKVHGSSGPRCTPDFVSKDLDVSDNLLLLLLFSDAGDCGDEEYDFPAAFVASTTAADELDNDDCGSGGRGGRVLPLLAVLAVASEGGTPATTTKSLPPPPPPAPAAPAAATAAAADTTAAVAAATIFVTCSSPPPLIDGGVGASAETGKGVCFQSARSLQSPSTFTPDDFPVALSLCVILCVTRGWPWCCCDEVAAEGDEGDSDDDDGADTDT